MIEILYASLCWNCILHIITIYCAISNYCFFHMKFSISVSDKWENRCMNWIMHISSSTCKDGKLEMEKTAKENMYNSYFNYHFHTVQGTGGAGFRAPLRLYYSATCEIWNLSNCSMSGVVKCIWLLASKNIYPHNSISA